LSSSEPQYDEDQPDLPLSPEEEAIYAALSDADLKEIDAALLEDCVRYGRKVARVVGTTFISAKFRDRDIPLSCFVQRVVELVRQGKLIAEGNLNYMRYSEVRLPSSATATPGVEGEQT
jgi:hypothetical protein